MIPHHPLIVRALYLSWGLLQMDNASLANLQREALKRDGRKSPSHNLGISAAPLSVLLACLLAPLFEVF